MRQELEAGEVRASKRLPLRLCSRRPLLLLLLHLLPVAIVMIGAAAFEKETWTAGPILGGVDHS